MEIYKILRPAEFEALERDGTTLGAPVDLADGFVHLSTADQVGETLRKHFADAGPVVLCACGADALGSDLRWEPSRGGALFPHLYRALRRDDIAWHETLPEGHDLPARVG